MCCSMPENFSFNSTATGHVVVVVIPYQNNIADKSKRDRNGVDDSVVRYNKSLYFGPLTSFVAYYVNLMLYIIRGRDV